MLLKKLKWFKIIRDTLLYYLLIIISWIVYTASFFSLNEILFDGKYIEKFSILAEEGIEEDKVAELILPMVFNTPILLASNLFLLACILISGRSDPKNRILHMSIVAGIIWLPASFGVFSGNIDYLWQSYNIATLIISVVIAHYIYKCQATTSNLNKD